MAQTVSIGLSQIYSNGWIMLTVGILALIIGGAVYYYTPQYHAISGFVIFFGILSLIVSAYMFYLHATHQPNSRP